MVVVLQHNRSTVRLLADRLGTNLCTRGTACLELENPTPVGR